MRAGNIYFAANLKELNLDISSLLTKPGGRVYMGESTTILFVSLI